jgi:Zinc knuckle
LAERKDGRRYVSVAALVPTDIAARLLSRRIKIGWQGCRIAEFFIPLRCFKCQGFGHVAAVYKSVNVCEKKCFNCGENGHEA